MARRPLCRTGEQCDGGYRTDSERSRRRLRVTVRNRGNRGRRVARGVNATIWGWVRLFHTSAIRLQCSVQGCAKVHAAHQAAHAQTGRTRSHSNPTEEGHAHGGIIMVCRTATSAVELRDESLVVHDRRRRRLRKGLRAHSRQQSIQKRCRESNGEKRKRSTHALRWRLCEERQGDGDGDADDRRQEGARGQLGQSLLRRRRGRHLLRRLHEDPTIGPCRSSFSSHRLSGESRVSWNPLLEGMLDGTCPAEGERPQ